MSDRVPGLGSAMQSMIQPQGSVKVRRQGTKYVAYVTVCT